MKGLLPSFFTKKQIFFAALTVFLAERINAFLAKHWKSFAKQPYFDPHGVFFSAVVSAPLLLVMFFLVVRFNFFLGR